MTSSRRRAGTRPVPRTVTVTGKEGSDYADWELTGRADFRVAWLVELQSGDVARILAVLEKIVTDHNLPDSEGEIAKRLEDVDPYDGLIVLAAELTERIGKLPPR